MKKKIIPLIIVILLGYGLFHLIKGKKTQPSVNGLVLYYSETCPHCEVVKEFIDKNDVEDDLGLVQKEISKNKDNNEELLKQAARCGIPPSSAGVPIPFLWNGSGCEYGDDNIINTLKKKLNEK